jgi:hypothetical protein
MVCEPVLQKESEQSNVAKESSVVPHYQNVGAAQKESPYEIVGE